MIYQETYQAGGDPTKLNISGVLYTHNLSTFLPPPGAEKQRLSVTLSFFLRNRLYDGRNLSIRV